MDSSSESNAYYSPFHQLKYMQVIIAQSFSMVLHIWVDTSSPLLQTLLIDSVSFPC